MKQSTPQLYLVNLEIKLKRKRTLHYGRSLGDQEIRLRPRPDPLLFLANAADENEGSRDLDFPVAEFAVENIG